MGNTLSAVNHRTMLVVWSWTQSGAEATSNEWTVVGSRRHQDRLICADRPASPASEDWITERVREWSEEGDVFVFLHRRHHYDQKAIQRLLAQQQPQQNQVRFFLFGEGSDAIYLSRSARGLLGTTGTFSGRYKRDQQEEQYLSAVAKAEDHLLHAAHFEYVWRFYEGAFKLRVFELKEDLFTALAPLLNSGSVPAGQLYPFLKQPQNRHLLLRLLSFVDKIRAGSGLEEELRLIEATENRPFRFDDCSQNITMTYGKEAALRYQQLAEVIRKDVLSTGQAVDFRHLRDLFAGLLAAMPGETYA